MPTYSLSGEEDYEFEAILNYIIARVCSKMKIKEFIEKNLCPLYQLFYMTFNSFLHSHKNSFRTKDWSPGIRKCSQTECPSSIQTTPVRSSVPSLDDSEAAVPTCCLPYPQCPESLRKPAEFQSLIKFLIADHLI